MSRQVKWRTRTLGNPYVDILEEYRDLVEQGARELGFAWDRDRFCLEQEVLRRLEKELSACDEAITQWATLYGPEWPPGVVRGLQREARDSIDGHLRQIERNLKAFGVRSCQSSKVRTDRPARQVDGEKVPMAPVVKSEE